jgi:hypothetical protein
MAAEHIRNAEGSGQHGFTRNAVAAAGEACADA